MYVGFGEEAFFRKKILHTRDKRNCFFQVQISTDVIVAAAAAAAIVVGVVNSVAEQQH